MTGFGVVSRTVVYFLISADDEPVRMVSPSCFPSGRTSWEKVLAGSISRHEANIHTDKKGAGRMLNG